ncbi:hypothetical protein BN137_953 [Cronobacter condimenti 1330]|uniref:Uncharacterized protein n=1 Tax=Cronobacter condimenti 1330 TaxID=1073999 RepID=K7ZYG6_9ENTR|nr:hypothetical protein BN137_953 [Cronobacter condimenti 1330]
MFRRPAGRLFYGHLARCYSAKSVTAVYIMGSGFAAPAGSAHS